MKKHLINTQNPFIRGYYLDHTILDKCIDFINTSDNTFEGRAGGSVNKEWKDSTDVEMPQELGEEYYYEILNPSVTEYVNEFEVLKEQNQFGIQEYINIQHYAPKQGYHAWHSERAGVGIANTRLLAFMTYLNDVENGGETSWLYQNLKIKPERGLTVIWPADWTHTHRGITAPNEHKYITTGWLSYWNIVDENSSIK